MYISLLWFNLLYSLVVATLQIVYENLKIISYEITWIFMSQKFFHCRYDSSQIYTWAIVLMRWLYRFLPTNSVGLLNFCDCYHIYIMLYLKCYVRYFKIWICVVMRYLLSSYLVIMLHTINLRYDHMGCSAYELDECMYSSALHKCMFIGCVVSEFEIMMYHKCAYFRIKPTRLLIKA